MLTPFMETPKRDFRLRQDFGKSLNLGKFVEIQRFPEILTEAEISFGRLHKWCEQAWKIREPPYRAPFSALQNGPL